MASLASVTPGASYPGLIKTIDNLALTGCSQLSDGCGNALPISISPAICALNFGATGNVATGCNAFILSGAGNCALGAFSVISGNNQCAIGADSVILGGYGNKAIQYNSIIFGARNTVCGSYYHSTIAGGADNFIDGALHFIGNGLGNKICGGACNTIVGGENNCIIAGAGPIHTNFIGGGRCNRLIADTINAKNIEHSTISGGCTNCMVGVRYATIAGGAYNKIDNSANATPSEGGGFIGSGVFNRVSATQASIVGGISNINNGSYGFIAGGCCNTAAGTFSSIGGGSNNCVTGSYASVFGGQLNTATCAHAGVFGCGITASMACAFHTNRIVVTQLPSSSAGLPSGAMWYDPAAGNVVKYVP